MFHRHRHLQAAAGGAGRQGCEPHRLVQGAEEPEVQGVRFAGGGPGGNQEGERLLQGAQIEEPGQDRPVAWKSLW